MKFDLIKKRKNKYVRLIKYIFISLIVSLAILIGYQLRKHNSFLKIIFLFFIILSVIFIGLYTKEGKSILRTVKESILEVKKVIWPSYTETFQTTLIILFFTAVMSTILFCTDCILIKLISLILK
ncbi:hypothetical protein AOQ88_01495 [Candidatus Riesia sp. GBBU]|nr:hypothetical protein AOQ88_01495 [Candidatus Riesia sp. GBBU]